MERSFAFSPTFDALVGALLAGSPRFWSPVPAQTNRASKRILAFDGDGNCKSQFAGIGTPIARCMTTASLPPRINSLRWAAPVYGIGTPRNTGAQFLGERGT